MKVQIEVTDEDILTGSPRHCYGCPIARAVSRVVNPSKDVAGWQVEVGCTALFFRLGIGKSYPARLPWPAIYFITSYDNGNLEVIKPFTFELEVPDEVIEKAINKS